MFRKTLLAALLLVASGAAAAQTVQTVQTPLFSADRFRSHVAFLSSDLLEGREAGSHGYEVAAAYVSSQFEGLGLEPAGEDGGWYQQVPLRSTELSDDEPTLTFTTPSGSKAWENRGAVLVGPSAMEQEQDISAPVVFVGYGLDAPRQRLDDYRGLDVRGKIVAALSGTPEDVPSEIAAHLNSEKLKMAAARGAIGFITVGTETSDEAVPWDLRLRYAGGASMTWVGKDGKPLDETPGLRFTARLDTPAAAALFEGSRKSYAAVRAEAARRGVRPRGFALKTEARLTRTSVWTDETSPNVVWLLRGSDPALRDQYVVLMGHLDHIGLDEDAKPGEDAINNGALDNAAGIATMIEAARAFSLSGERPKRSILFIAVTAEEKGLIGAEYFARHPTVPIGSIAAAVNLDMPLLLYDFTDVIAFGAEHSTVAAAVDQAAQSMGIALSPDPMPQENVFVRSDHYMFVQQGVPAIMLATGHANGGAAKWGAFLGGNYHNVGDDMSQEIDWQAGAKYARLNYLIARTLANASARPLWYEGNFFGNLYAPDAPRAPAPQG